MKTPRSLLILLAGIGPALVLGSVGCSKSTTSSASASAEDAKAGIKDAAIDVKNAAVDSWDSVRDYTYEKRADFSSSMDRMDKSMDDKIAELKAKGSYSSDSVKSDKEAAIKDYDKARDDLKARLADLSNASSDGWADAKAKVSEAWQRVKAAYDRATS
jgi:oligoribonuclease NrnB/cAMP/cGMP phosphodiesterase (DHH superfamily)